MKQRSRLIIFFLFIIAVLFYINTKNKFINKIFFSLVLDNRIHGLPCDKLPNVTEIDKIISEHKDVVEKIITKTSENNNSKVEIYWSNNSVLNSLDNNVTFFWGESADCQRSKRGDIEISYPSHKDRKIINSDTFFGIPYRLINI